MATCFPPEFAGTKPAYRRLHGCSTHTPPPSLPRSLHRALPPLQGKAEKEGPRVPAWAVGALIFVVVGSAIFQIVQSAMAGSPLSE